MAASGLKGPYKLPKGIAAFLEILELVEAGAGRGEEYDIACLTISMSNSHRIGEFGFPVYRDNLADYFCQVVRSGTINNELFDSLLDQIC